MRIILDTNIIQEDFLMKSGRFAVLFDYAARTQSTFILPRIVHDELAANYERQLVDRLNKAIGARAQLNGMLLRQDPNRIELDTTTVAGEYITYVLQRLEVSEEEIYEYKPNYLHDVLQRAIGRRRPCTDRGEEIRDAVLWHSVLDVAEAAGEPVVFISKNTDQFADNRTSLHPDLAAEADARGVALEYVPSLEEFGRRHATPIAFITKEWLESQIDPDTLYDAVFDRAVETAAEIAHRRAGADEEVEGAYSNAGGGIEVDEFFVYVMRTGSYRVESRWYGRAEIEYEVEVDDSLWGDWGRKHTRSRTAHVLLHATVEAIVENQKMTEWRIIEAFTEPD
jgi:hypothetical protein